MSLQVWINNIYNKGLSDVVISYTGTPVMNMGDGITGTCSSLSDDYYNINTGYGNGLSTDEKSIAIWVKPTNTNDSKMLLRTTGTTPGRLYLGIKNSTWNLAYGDNTWGYTSNAPVLVNEWQHICITIKHGIATLYYNGEFIETKSGDDFIMPSNIILSPSGSVFTGCCDDIRIYDHCLSPKEVYDITKGLVLHYKLDNIPNKNLVNSLKSYSNDSYLAYQFNLSENFIAGQTYIFQLWDVNVTHSGKNEAQLGISIFWGGESVSLKAMNGTSWFTNGHADYIKFSITITSSQASGSGATNSWINIYNSVLYASGEKSMHIGAIKIEKGSNATEYTPYNEVTTQVTDSSGYNFHGTITGSLSVTNDTPRYNYATHFDGSSYIKISRYIVNNYYPKTISFWANWDSIPSGQSVLFVDSYTNTGFGLMSTGILLTTSGAGNSYIYPKSGIVANTWYHFVIVITGTTGRDLYINGVKQRPTSNQSTWTYNVNELQIGKRSTTSDGFVGKMSDFRIYAKALSADDVKELYDTAALIDNIGNLECYKISEEDVSSQEVMKTGVVKTPMFIESNERLKVLDDGSVWLQILHHNNPAQHIFAQTNCWFYNDNENLFSMLQILKDEPWITSLTEFEFLACEKLTSSSTEAKYRWKQTSNPALSSTLSGYELISGSPGRDIGLMNKGTYGCFHNGSTWWCCCGSYSAHSGGIPGFGGTVTSGYLDLYIKIPFDILNSDISEQAKFFKKSIVTNQLLEV